MSVSLVLQQPVTQPFNEQGPTPYYLSRYKVLRVVGGSIRDAFIAWAYAITAICCRIFQLHAAQKRFNQLAEYFFMRSLRLKVIYRPPAKIVNFSMNSMPRPSLFLPEGVSKAEVLKKMYGSLFEQMREKAHSGPSQLDLDHVEIPMMGIDGICSGECMDFASRLLQQDRTQSLLQTIHHVSSRFIDGGTEESQIAQILMQAQSKWMSSDNRDATYLPNLVADICHDAGFSREHIRAKRDCVETLLHKMCMYWSCQSAADALDIHLEFVQKIVPTEQAPIGPAANSVIRSMPAGVYLLKRLRPEQHSHAMLYIKESDKRSYFFEPTRATYMTSDPKEHSDMIIELLQDALQLLIIKCQKKITDTGFGSLQQQVREMMLA